MRLIESHFGSPLTVAVLLAVLFPADGVLGEGAATLSLWYDRPAKRWERKAMLKLMKR